MKLPDHLFPFQADAMRELAGHRAQVLGLPPGSGKSVVAIAAWELVGAFNVLIVCPAIVRQDWKDKIARFAGQTYSVNKGPGHGRSVVIRSYEEVNTPARRTALLEGTHTFDAIVLDEAQRLRNLDAGITQSIYGAGANGRGLAVRGRHVWPMSGTIAVNHIGDLYPHLRALAPQLLPQVAGAPMRYQQFMDHFGVYERGKWGMKVLDLKNVEELKGIVGKFVIQCPQSVVDAQLPKLRVELVTLDESELNWAQYLEFAASSEGKALEAACAMDHIWHLTDSLSAARRMLGEMKAPAVARYVRELLEQDPDARVLVFGHHKQVLQRMWADLYDLDPNVRVINGEVSEPLRHAYIDAFQRGKARVLIAGIGTMREGITLTAANRVVMAEASWVPADNHQAIRRAYRIGQERPVLAEYVCIAGTLDEAVTRVCARKYRQLSELF